MIEGAQFTVLKLFLQDPADIEGRVPQHTLQRLSDLWSRFRPIRRIRVNPWTPHWGFTPGKTNLTYIVMFFTHLSFIEDHKADYPYPRLIIIRLLIHSFSAFRPFYKPRHLQHSHRPETRDRSSINVVLCCMKYKSMFSVSWGKVGRRYQQ